MKTMSNEDAVESFVSAHHFRIQEAMKDDERAVLWLLGIKHAISDDLENHREFLEAAKVSTWRMLEHMLDRVHEHVAAAVVCYFTGSWASMEVVVRAAIEAAVTNIYITMENKEERLGQYFGNYFREVRASLERSQRSKSVEDALTSLEQREKWFRDIAQLDGIKILNRGWPRRVVDRFRESGMEEAYRTIYSVLSSQTHGDADATVDYVIYKCVRIPGYDHQRATVTEGVFWMRLYLYYCLRIYALAALSYAGAFDLGGASAKILVLKEEIEQLIDSISAAFESESTALEAAAFGELDERRDGAEHV